MIKHHPTFELIQTFVQGELPASLSAGITMHAQMCPQCKKIIEQLTEQAASVCFEPEHQAIDTPMAAFNFDAIIDEITSCDAIDRVQAKAPVTMTFRAQEYRLPDAIANMDYGKTMHIGKLARSRIQLDEGEIRTSLLHIEAGGGVPEHTHNGFELTLLLAGSFHDQQGTYVAGDFIMLDGRHQHNPMSENGCLCYTVVNDSLRFTQGINKLLNPIGSFIY